MGLRKMPNATIDIKKVLLIDSTNREAQRLLSEIDDVKAYIKLIDKNLSRCLSVGTNSNRKLKQ
jgi:lipopolysaccharide biosynthesis protein